MTKDELCRHIQQTTFLEACQIKCVRDFLCFCSVTFQWFPCKSSWYLSLSGSSIMPCKSIISILSSKTSQLSATMGSSHCPLYIFAPHISGPTFQFSLRRFTLLWFCFTLHLSVCITSLLYVCLSLLISFFPQPFVVSCIPVLFLFPLSQT